MNAIQHFLLSDANILILSILGFLGFVGAALTWGRDPKAANYTKLVLSWAMWSVIPGAFLFVYWLLKSPAK